MMDENVMRNIRIESWWCWGKCWNPKTYTSSIHEFSSLHVIPSFLKSQKEIRQCPDLQFVSLYHDLTLMIPFPIWKIRKKISSSFYQFPESDVPLLLTFCPSQPYKLRCSGIFSVTWFISWFPKYVETLYKRNRSCIANEARCLVCDQSLTVGPKATSVCFC